jgi:hypothetical protein
MFTTYALCCHMCSHGTPVCCVIISAKRVRARPSAARARQAARLLHKLRALERQRRGNALLGRCLRLGARLSARLVHLGTTAHSARHHEQVGRIHTLQLISTTNPHAARRMACKAAPHSLPHTQCTKTSQGSAVDIPVAAHAQPAARLLDKLRALECQRCGNLLLGCCLRRARLGARLIHLGKFARSGGHGTC